MLRLLPVVLLAACQLEPFGGDGGGKRTGAEDCVQGAYITADGIGGELPLTVNFIGLAQCGGEWSAAWDFGDGETGTGANVAHTWLASGTYDVALALTGASGETLDASFAIEVLPASCPEAEAPVQLGLVESAELTEASGLAEGRRNPGVLWSHNDSGDTPRLFALDADGAHRGTFLLSDAPEGDWEDLAAGEDAAGAPVLYVGDIGANGASRDTLTIHVVPEPDVPDEPYNVLVTDAWSFDVAFPDGPALDAAALLWDPASGDLFLAAREADDVTGLYRAPAPFTAGATVPLERVTGFALGAGGGDANVTGGDISPLGDRLVLRTVDAAWLWRRDRRDGIDLAWASEPCPLPLAEEPLGEALAFSADGGGYYTLSEGAAQPVWYTAFAPPEAPCDGLTPAIVATADSLAIPAEVAFSVDTTCVFNGVALATWDYGDGETEVGDRPTHTFLASGAHTVTLTVLDGAGATETVTTTIEVLPADCPVPGETVTWGTIASDEIVEASGLGHSALNPGVLWTHNDSSDSARLFAVSASGGHLGEYTVVTDNRDWEDLSLGWDDTLGAPALYVGDFGDNGESRDHVTVLVVPEPALDLADVPVTAEITSFAELTLLYPDGAHNAETLMCDPVTGDLYIVTKDYGGETSIFRKPAPHLGGTSTTLEHVADLTFGEDPLPGSGATTAGDFSPLGDRIAIRTYSHAYMWRRDQALSVADAFAGAACDLGAPDEPQGEALAFTTDGAGYLTLSEGEHQPLYFTPLE